MTDKFEIKGEWFLPKEKDNRVHGILTFDPQNGIDLELYGSLNGTYFLHEFKDQEIILGLTSESKQVTLSQCLMAKSSVATSFEGEESGKPSTTYSIRYLLIGYHAATSSDLVFNQISSEIFNLGEWVGITGFKSQHINPEALKDHEITVEYKLPDPIEFELNNSIKGKFKFLVNRPELSRYQKSSTISQRVEFQAISENAKNIDDLIKYVISFQNFLTLALYRSTYPLTITLSSEKYKKNYRNGETTKKCIDLYYSSRNLKLNKKTKYDVEMIFDYRRIRDNFEIIIKKWYSKYDLLEPAFELVFEQFYNENRFTANTFLNLVQSAETFHARVNNHTKIPQEQYKKMKDDILKVVPSRYHDWLKDQFNFGNNLNLHSRLKELTEKYSNIILDKIIGDKNKFVLNVKNSRNYYTHYSKGGDKKALKGAELFYLAERLKILLVCSFLNEVGFEKDQLSRLLEKVKWTLFNHLANWKNDEGK